MSTCDQPARRWYNAKGYGYPKPRFIIPLVRINGQMQDMPAGYKIHPCMLPPTLIKIDTCSHTLQINDAIVDYTAMQPCYKLPVGSDVPTEPPSDGYYPFYFKSDTRDFYVWIGATWELTT